MFSQFLLYTSLCIILDRLQNAVHDQETNEHGEVMQEVRTYIDKNYAQDISLEYIADHFHLSVYYLARQFRKYTAYTVNKYIVSCRIGEAQRRLIHTDDRIDDIAVICGYTNLSYFYASYLRKMSAAHRWNSEMPTKTRQRYFMQRKHCHP